MTWESTVTSTRLHVWMTCGICTRTRSHALLTMIGAREPTYWLHWRPTWNVQETLPKPPTVCSYIETRSSSAWSACNRCAILIYKSAVTGLHCKLLSRFSNCAQAGYKKHVRNKKSGIHEWMPDYLKSALIKLLRTSYFHHQLHQQQYPFP